MDRIKIDWKGIFIVMFLSCVVIVASNDRTLVPDIRYLYNRAEQMLECLQDGRIPFFYYNDFGGVGYGSSFFYGQLTLYPFLIFVKMGIAQFLNAYTVVTIALTYTGACFLGKRFTKNYKFVALLYMCSCWSVQSFFSFATLSNMLATAISFYFIGFCIDFFRDRKSFIPASIMFYLIINTHLVTAVISFLICVMLFVMYFDKSRFKDYVKFALFTTFICSYFLIDVLYHSGVVNNTEFINNRMLKYVEAGNDNVICNYQSKFPFTGVIFNIILAKFGLAGIDGYHLINLSIVVLLIVWGRHKFSKREISCLIISLLATLVSIRYFWILVNKVWLNPIQFPCRFTAYIVLCILLVCLRNVELSKIKSRVFILCCLPELLLIPFVTEPTDRALLEYDNPYSHQVINGEYLDKSFSWDLDDFEYKKNHVTDQYGNEYDFGIFTDKVVVSVNAKQSGDLQLTFPKLYYKGYVLYKVTEPETFAEIDEDEFYEKSYKSFITDTYDVEMGDSQFIKANIGNSRGTFILMYKHPLWLILLDMFTLITVVACVVMLVIRRPSSNLG